MPSNSYFEERIVRAETDPLSLDYVTQTELRHYNYIDFPVMRDKVIYQRAKESQVCCLLLPFLARLRSVPDNSWGLLVN